MLEPLSIGPIWNLRPGDADARVAASRAVSYNPGNGETTVASLLITKRWKSHAVE
jgi:hypothetical protein